MKRFSKLFFAVSVLLASAQCSSAPRRSLLPATEDQMDVSRWNRTEGCCAAEGSRAAIASGGTHSSQAGLEILEQGGSLVDAAVAVGFALCVERPQSTGIGGGGFATLHIDGKDFFLDFRETAPAAAKRDMFLDPSGRVLPGHPSQDSIFAVATPGLVAGLWELHQKWGKLPWKRVLEPAVRLAKEGFTVYPSLAEKIESSKKPLGRLPHSRAIYFQEKRPMGTGDKLVQSELGDTLIQIAEHGLEGFYTGQTADRILATVRQYGGLLTAKDLEDYRPLWREPIRFSWRGYSVVTAPPPSAGGVVLAETFKIWDRLQPKEGGSTESQHIHWLAEGFKRAYAERSEAIGDPSQVKVPVEKLISDGFVDGLRKGISDKATPSSTIRPGAPGKATHGTTGFSLVDDQGNAIAATTTINTRFGSHILVPKTGIFLNNEMDDFSIKPGEKNAFGLTGGQANSIAPGKRPVSSMTPTLIFEGKRPVLAVSGAGGSRIITAVVQTALNYLAVYPGDLRRAVFAPRMHHQWLPDKLDLEPGFSDSTREDLKKRGHALASPDWNPIITAAGSDGGRLTAVFDPREEGGAAAR